MARATNNGSIKVLIADDHRSFGEALQVALDKERDLTVIEVVTDGVGAVDAAAELAPDVVVLDMQMPGMDGIEATRRIVDASSDSKVIVLSGLDDDVGLARAVQAGARGYLRKTEAVMTVADAIRHAARDEPLNTRAELEESLSRLRRRKARDGNLRKRLDRLTPREVEILQLLADGRSVAEIAE